ncbi:MAG TPA: thioredoxin-like domain-containing protein [Armatimonadota bacterium]|jgi:thiol-disulfide isomerase/thioredoxin
MSVSMQNVPEFPEGFTWLNTDHPLRLHEELRGRVVILDFWTYCCINCMHVLPELAYLERKYAHDPVVIIGVHSNKYTNEANPANVREAVLRYDITHPVVVDEDHTIWDMYGVNAWPTVVVIDSAGHAIGALSGEGHREELDRLIAALLEIGREQGTLADGPIPLTPEAHHHVSTLSFPGKILVSPQDKRLFIADSGHNRVLIMDWDGEVEGFLGNGMPGFMNGSYADARFHHPQGLAYFGGALYIADTENHAIRRADLSSFHVATVLGNGMIGYDRRGGHRGTEQLLNSPWDLAFLDGTMYIAMAGLHQIWAYNPVTEVAEVVIGTGRENIADNEGRKSALAQPSGLAGTDEVLYFADSETSAIRRYDLHTQQVQTLVGKGLFTFGDSDGPLDHALLQHPLGVAAVGHDLYVADSYNHKIRRIDLRSGTVSTLAGTGAPGRGASGLLALNEPGGLAVAGNDLFIADTNNDRIIHYRLDTGAWREIVPKLNGKPLEEAA